VKKKKKQRQKRISKQVFNAPFMQKTRLPVPEDLWLACVDVYQNAAALRMPVENPEERKLNIGDTIYGFADIPMNRGMFAVMDFARQPELHPALTTRIMAMGAVLSELRMDARFSPFFKDSAADRSWMVEEALMKAFASADFQAGTLSFDLESVLAVAQAIAEKDPDD
jgi:hypothetical protein